MVPGATTSSRGLPDRCSRWRPRRRERPIPTPPRSPPRPGAGQRNSRPRRSAPAPRVTPSAKRATPCSRSSRPVRSATRHSRRGAGPKRAGGRCRACRSRTRTLLARRRAAAEAAGPARRDLARFLRHCEEAVQAAPPPAGRRRGALGSSRDPPVSGRPRRLGRVDRVALLRTVACRNASRRGRGAGGRGLARCGGGPARRDGRRGCRGRGGRDPVAARPCRATSGASAPERRPGHAMLPRSTPCCPGLLGAGDRRDARDGGWLARALRYAPDARDPAGRLALAAGVRRGLARRAGGKRSGAQGAGQTCRRCFPARRRIFLRRTRSSWPRRGRSRRKASRRPSPSSSSRAIPRMQALPGWSPAGVPRSRNRPRPPLGPADRPGHAGPLYRRRLGRGGGRGCARRRAQGGDGGRAGHRPERRSAGRRRRSSSRSCSAAPSMPGRTSLPTSG